MTPSAARSDGPDGPATQVEPSASYRFREVGYDSAEAARLIDEIQAETAARYGGPDESPVDPEEFTRPTGVFVVLEVEGVLAGCGGLRRIDDTSVELKRMYVRPQFRRTGLARRLIEVLEWAARDMGATRMLLETGTAQPEAMALYEAAGFTLITGFGHYQGEPQSRAYAKSL